MRINLVTPFAEKDAVKALGARWDATKKCWYIVDVADLTAFSRWIPKVDVVTSNTTVQVTKPKSTPSINAPVSPADCGCNVLPWENCTHTANM